jgi:hypothetical protein
MCSAVELASFFTADQEIGEPRRLQTAMFIAQERCSYRPYRYRLQKGRVVSDELDQDVAQLAAVGVISLLCDSDHRDDRFVTSGIGGWPRTLSDSLGSLKDSFVQLISAPAQTLEAAATMLYFRGSPTADVNRLRWFVMLDENTKRSAEALVPAETPEENS